MTEFNAFTPETVELIRRSVGTFWGATTRHYVDLPRDLSDDRPGDDRDG